MQLTSLYIGFAPLTKEHDGWDVVEAKQKSKACRRLASAVLGQITCEILFPYHAKTSLVVSLCWCNSTTSE